MGKCPKIVWAGYENAAMNVEVAHVVRMIFLGGLGVVFSGGVTQELSAHWLCV